jgi:hypothetical protein
VHRYYEVCFIDFIVDTEEDGAILDLDTTPCCRVSLSARDGCYIYCSAVSANAQWIAYSDQRSVRLFHISEVVHFLLVEAVHFCFVLCYNLHKLALLVLTVAKKKHRYQVILKYVRSYRTLMCLFVQ